ncbi:MAG: ABC-F family ATP-binding cassette domain-containing protein [Lachnospiraceae bacterium]|nr:ABC-F family ATP-binding cassette domain-containing protein [Lachnospiraceae bacterium]
MLYQITNGTVSMGGQVILSHIDFEIKGKEKIAIVGRNGAGKTTLLRLIAGELSVDRDDRQKQQAISSSRKVTVGMLRQNTRQDQDKTVEELLLEGCPEKDSFSKERFTYEMEYNRIFTGFGFDKQEKKKKLADFSGGEQTKISLIRLLLMKPDILLLDEPTNHLDIPTVEWLEQYMADYDKAVVFVSHDRFFLDQVVDVVYELQNGKLKKYAGNYTHYREQKRKDLVIQKKSYESQQAELKRLNELIEKFKHKPKKAAFARSRKTLIDRMERIEKPEADDVHIFTGELEPQVLGGKWVLEAEHLKIGYEKALLEMSLRVRRGQKIGIIGDNGVGKTTFLKTVVGELPPVSGKCELGNHILMGYFDQQSAAISSEKQVVEHFHDLFPAMTEKDVRQTLGAYLFQGKDASKKVDVLSGGEKARLVLAEMLSSRPNLLVLDEPTNHMDIQAKETLESAFQAYTGTILFVSHDRYFIQQVADAILVFEGQSVMYYPFGYVHYLKKKRQREESEGDFTALIRAEEQAMVADFKAVPKAERHRLREFSTEEVYLDWKFRLAAEPMQEAREKVEILWDRWNRLQTELEEKSWEIYMSKQGLGDTISGQIQQEYDHMSVQTAQIKKELDMAWEHWHNQCMGWTELYIDEIEH